MLGAMNDRNPFEPMVAEQSHRPGNRTVKHVPGKAMCKALERKGWTFDRITGSHHIYVSPDGTRSISAPVHGNRIMKPGTQHAIMKQAALTDADL